MVKKVKILLACLLFVSMLNIIDNKSVKTASAANSDKVKPATVKNTEVKPALSIENNKHINPLDLVNNPQAYLNTEVKIDAKFDKFSVIGLDYKPVDRSSKDYISFLIKRPDVADEYTIPLSELKLILKREQAEKLIDLETGDHIEIIGKVFSTALNDPWVDVSNVNILTVKNDKTASKKASNGSVR